MRIFSDLGTVPKKTTHGTAPSKHPCGFPATEAAHGSHGSHGAGLARSTQPPRVGARRSHPTRLWPNTPQRWRSPPSAVRLERALRLEARPARGVPAGRVCDQAGRSDRRSVAGAGRGCSPSRSGLLPLTRPAHPGGEASFRNGFSELAVPVIHVALAARHDVVRPVLGEDAELFAVRVDGDGG
jgi:hypothetical protein